MSRLSSTNDSFLNVLSEQGLLRSNWCFKTIALYTNWYLYY
jgi:hypothetical protein